MGGRSVSRILFYAVIHLMRSTRRSGEADHLASLKKDSLLFDLAQSGVYLAIHLSMNPVVSYTAFSPLPVFDGRYFFCGTCRAIDNKLPNRPRR